MYTNVSPVLKISLRVIGTELGPYSSGRMNWQSWVRIQPPELRIPYDVNKNAPHYCPAAFNKLWLHDGGFIDNLHFTHSG